MCGEQPFACKPYKRCSRVPATQPSPSVKKGVVGLFDARVRGYAASRLKTHSLV